MLPRHKYFGGFLARINIEDELRTDPRFDQLCDLISKQMAYGAVIILWQSGMAYWKKNRSPIPEHIAEHLPNKSELVRTGFLKPVEGGYYCSGSNERWDFLLARSDAGKRSAEVRRAKFGSAVPKNASNAEQKPNKTEHSSSSSSSISKSNTRIHTSHCPDVEQPDLSPDLGDGLHWLAQLWNDFCGTHLAKVKLTTPGSARMKKIVSRTKAHPDRQQWALAIQNLAKSDFHTGQSGKRGERPWKADFDWFLSKEENFARGIEDSFAGKSQKHFTHERENEQTTDEILADVYKAHGMEAPGGTKSR